MGWQLAAAALAAWALETGCPLGFDYIGSPDASEPKRKAKESGDAVGSSTALDAGPTNPHDSFKRGPEAQMLMPLPCATPRSLSYQPSAHSLLLTCGGTESGFFRAPLNPHEPQQDWEHIVALSADATHHSPLPGNAYLVNHTNPDGFSLINTEQKTVYDRVLFSQLTRVSHFLDMTPNSATGALFISQRPCVTVQNAQYAADETMPSRFADGAIICFYLRQSDQMITDSTGWAHMTSGKRPTGMVQIDNERFAVLSSNAERDLPHQHAFLNLFSSREQIQRISQLDLGPIVAQDAPTLTKVEPHPATNGALLLIGVQQPEARLIGIDVERNRKAFDIAIEGVSKKISNVVAFEHVAIMIDSPMIGSSQLLYADHETEQQLPRITELDGSIAGAALVGSTLYLATIKPDAAYGDLVAVDLSRDF